MTSREHGKGIDWAPPPRVFAFSSQDKNQIEILDELPFLSVSFRPLLKDSFRLEAHGTHGKALTQWRTNAPYGFVSSPKVALDKITIRFVSQGSMVRRNSRSYHVGTCGMGMVVAFEEMVTEEASAGFQAFAGTVDRVALLASHVALEGDDEQPFPQFLPVTDVQDGPLRAFRHNFQLLHQRLKEGLDVGNLHHSLLEEMLLYQFLTAWPKQGGQGERSTSTPPSWQVRRALDYIDGHLQHKMTLAEIASAAQIGVRSLQLSFRKELDRTPIQWILERRLWSVHRELACSSFDHASISETARKWGFVHMADFSRRYRELFGETPVKTRAKRR